MGGGLCFFCVCVSEFLFATWTQKMLLAPYMYAHVFPRWPAARAKGRATRAGVLRTAQGINTGGQIPLLTQVAKAGWEEEASCAWG